jgi:hypothetical protein
MPRRKSHFHIPLWTRCSRWQKIIATLTEDISHRDHGEHRGIESQKFFKHKSPESRCTLCICIRARALQEGERLYPFSSQKISGRGALWLIFLRLPRSFDDGNISVATLLQILCILCIDVKISILQRIEISQNRFTKLLPFTGFYNPCLRTTK